MLQLQVSTGGHYYSFHGKLNTGDIRSETAESYLDSVTTPHTLKKYSLTF